MEKDWRMVSTALVIIALTLIGGTASVSGDGVGPGRDMVPRIAILIAVPIEAEWIYPFFTLERHFVADGFNFSTGTIAGRKVVLEVGSEGEAAAAAAVVVTNRYFNVQWAVSIGTAGSHFAPIDVGDVVVVNRIFDDSSMRITSYSPMAWTWLGSTVMLPNGTTRNFMYLNTTGYLINLADQAAGLIPPFPITPAQYVGTGQPHTAVVVRNGTDASSDLWIANAAVIAQVHATTGSSDEEMEAFGFGVTCYRLGIPFIKIAVISDSDVTGSQFTYDTVRISMTNGLALLLEMIMLSSVGH